MKNTGKWKTAGVRTAAALLAAVTAIVPVRAEEIGSSWDEDTRVHVLRRKVATAINVYTDGLSQDVTHEEGVYDGVIYDILRVNPTEHTFLQVDFSEVPGYVNELKDWDTIAAGYRYAGGINAGYFINEGEQYGRPVGAVRRLDRRRNSSVCRRPPPRAPPLHSPSPPVRQRTRVTVHRAPAPALPRIDSNRRDTPSGI